MSGKNSTSNFNMDKIVLKFGGAAVANPQRIKHVANIIKSHIDNNEKVIVVVSAMQGFTDTLYNYINEVTENTENLRELDVVLASGEQITAGLLAIALNQIGVESQSFLGWQLPIYTNNIHAAAKIIRLETKQLNKKLSANITPIIAGFQGITKDNALTTLGRGGSDITAIALASYMQCSSCYFYKDVDGVYNQDPKVCSNAIKLSKLNYEEMLELSGNGAKVLHYNAVQLAQEKNINIVVKSFLNNLQGSIVSNN